MSYYLPENKKDLVRKEEWKKSEISFNKSSQDKVQVKKELN